MEVPEKICNFIRKHHVLTLATSSDDAPWCSNMFYAYIASENLLVFSSDVNTRHASQMQANTKVAASIVLETKVVGKLQGLQISGEILSADHTAVDIRKAFIKRFPYTAVADLTLWALKPSFMKFTDNTLGFGKKLTWSCLDNAE